RGALLFDRLGLCRGPRGLGGRQTRLRLLCVGRQRRRALLFLNSGVGSSPRRLLGGTLLIDGFGLGSFGCGTAFLGGLRFCSSPGGAPFLGDSCFGSKAGGPFQVSS